MSWLHLRSLDARARRHAELDVDLVEEEIVRRLGPRPVVDPVANHEAGKYAAAFNRSAEVNELDDDLRRVDVERTHHTRPIWILFGLLFCFAVEVLGGILILRSLGVSEGERLPLGIALGLALIGITAVASSRTTATEPSSVTRAGGSSAPVAKRFSTTALVLVIYSLLIVAIALVRLRSASEDGGSSDALPETVVMIATAVGPAWLAEWLLKKWRPTKILADRTVQLRRRRREIERERRAADAFLTRSSRAQAAWDTAAARLRATYVAEYRAARAARNLPPSSSAT